VNTYTDIVAEPLEEIIKRFQTENLKYIISYTRPTRDCSSLLENSLFVVRHLIDADGIHNLTVAAKLRQGGVKMAYRITEDCVACGACMATCPVEAIKEGDPYYTINEDCVDCGSCAESCPTGAILAP
jgi:NAD-dependent dihydropyrimidine dehydrogenase PreA subunit